MFFLCSLGDLQYSTWLCRLLSCCLGVAVEGQAVPDLCPGLPGTAKLKPLSVF